MMSTCNALNLNPTRPYPKSKRQSFSCDGRGRGAGRKRWIRSCSGNKTSQALYPLSWQIAKQKTCGQAP
eukprot:485280-Rhodomonas_salina.1